MAHKRIQKQLIRLKQEMAVDYSAAPFQGDIYHWKAFIFGPPRSPYEGGKFDLDVNFPSEYPFRPPKVIFLAKIYHPNINSNGEISLDVLSSYWSPALTIGRILAAIIRLLQDPNPDDCLSPDIAELFKRDRAGFDCIAKQWTEKYAVQMKENRIL